MKAIENLRKQLEAIGGTLEDTAWQLHCDAPAGYIWKANGLPSYPIQYATNQQSWLIEAIKLEFPSLKMGLRKVTDEKELKEIQFNLDDDNWIATAESPACLSFP